MRRLLAGHLRRRDSRYDNALTPDQKLVCKNLGRNDRTIRLLPTLAGAHEEGH